MIREFRPGEPRPNNHSEDIRRVNDALAHEIIILFRALGDKGQPPWAVEEIQKSISGVIDALRDRQALCVGLNFHSVVKIDTERVSALTFISSDLNRENFSLSDILNQLKMLLT